MRKARIYALLAAVGQCVCASSRPAVRAVLPIDTSSWKFDDGQPILPEGLVCLDWPLPELRRISSEFKDPDHAFTPGKHSGIDFPAPVGMEILAPAAGKVTETAAVTATGAASVTVRFGEGWTYAVHHLSRVDAVKDRPIGKGERLGLTGGEVGKPGSGPYTTGPHLHFSLSHADAYVNPVPYLCP